MAPETCGAEKLVPSSTAYWSPANSGSVDERTCAPGAITSGFSACPNGVSPPAEKLVGTPAHVVGTSSVSLLKRTVTVPPAPAALRIRAPSRSEIAPPASSLKTGAAAIARTVLDDDHPDRTGCAGTGALRRCTGSRRGSRALSLR